MNGKRWWYDIAASAVIMVLILIMAGMSGLAGVFPNWEFRSEQAGSRMSTDETGTDAKTYSFDFVAEADEKSKDTEQVDYSDSFFQQDNSIYDHQLAVSSLALALTGFKQVYAEDFLTDLGYEDIVSYRYDLKKDEDKAAMVFAHKKIGDSQVIAVCIRGGMYGDEWGSNGRLGNDGIAAGYHYGFHTAAEDALQQLADYAGEQNIQLQDCIIWLTGFSRGGAVANVLGEKLYQYEIITQGNLFCYTFAAPATVSESYLMKENGQKAGTAVLKTGNTGTGDASGIYNIVNPLDIVTRLPMDAGGRSQTRSGRTVAYEWDYTRYGTTLSLPGRDADKKTLSAVRSVFAQVTGGKAFYETKAEDIQVVDMLEHSLAFATRNQQRYVEKYQNDVIIPLFKENMGKTASETDKSNILSALIDSLPGVTTFIMTELNNLDFKAQLYIGNMISGAEEQRLLKEHWPETYWSWMQVVN